jgi:hypothetical protein
MLGGGIAAGNGAAVWTAWTRLLTGMSLWLWVYVSPALLLLPLRFDALNSLIKRSDYLAHLGLELS